MTIISPGSLRYGIIHSVMVEVPTPPMDGIADVWAAYGMRRLLSSYTGPLIRIRRDSDSAELDIPFDASGNLATATVTAFLSGANGFIVTWYDQGGNARNFGQTTAANQPSYNASAGFLTPGIEFNGTDQWLDDLTSPTHAASDYTVTALYNWDSTTGQQLIYSSNDFSANELNLPANSNVDTRRSYKTIADGYQLAPVAVAPFTGVQLQSWVLDGTNGGSIRLNTTALATGLTYTQTGLSGAHRVGRLVGSGSHFNGKMAALIIMDAAKTNAEMISFETDLIKSHLDTSNYVEDDIYGGYVVDEDGNFVTVS